jgi:hypothetical protein
VTSKAFDNVLKLNDILSVVDFGAKGDGVTDDAAAVQAALDAVEPLGGTLVFPPGRYLLGSQVTLNRTFATGSGGTFIGERNILISGYGAEIRTTGAISALDIRGGWPPNLTATIEGFTIYHRGNTQAVAGIRMIGSSLVTINEVTVAVSSSLPSGYAAFRMENADPTNVDTGCFWNIIRRCAVRPWSGAEGYCSFGVELIGTANATTLSQNAFSGSNTHVILKPHTGQAASPNSVVIDGNFFEGPNTATAIELSQPIASGGVYHITGTRITNNRFEALLNAVVLSGAGTTVQLPTYMAGNYAETAVTNYLVNSLNIPVIMLDAALVGAPMGPGRFQNQEGFLFRNDNASFDAVTVRGPNVGSGLAIHDPNGTLYARWAQRASIGTLLKGRYSGPSAPIFLGVIGGISSTDTDALNLAGAVAFTSAATKAVTFSLTEADANYNVYVTGNVNETFWVTSKTTTGFTINSSNATSTAIVSWLLIR